MQFVYKPEGVSDDQAKRWDFAPEKLMSPEAEVIERRTGMVYAEWTQAVTRGSVLALHGLLFVLLKRDRPTLKWDEVVFNLAELDFEMSDEESAEALAGLEKKAQSDELDPSDQALLELLRKDAPAVDPDKSDDEDDGPFEG